MYICIAGNIINGMTPYGPFDDPESAIEWAEQNCLEWNVIRLSEV